MRPLHWPWLCISTLHVSEMEDNTEISRFSRLILQVVGRYFDPTHIGAMGSIDYYCLLARVNEQAILPLPSRPDDLKNKIVFYIFKGDNLSRIISLGNFVSQLFCEDKKKR